MNELTPTEREQILGHNWRKIVAAIENLPPMPTVATKALRMVDDPDSTADEVADLLNSDPGLASQILRIANSPLFSSQREVSSVLQAVGSIGFKAIKGVILASVLRKVSKSFGEIDKLVWENSVCTAMAATKIARKLRKRYGDEVFLLGLLHNLGQLVFLSTNETTRDYLDVVYKIKENGVDFVNAEMEVIGCTYPRVGSLLANKWSFPPEVCQVILHHKDEEKKAENVFDEKLLVVDMADLVSHAAEVGNPENYPIELDRIRELALLLGFEEATVDGEIEDLIQEVKEQFRRESAIFG